MSAKFISNQRGGYKLIHEGHSYIKHRHRTSPIGEVTYWRCDQLHRLRCPGFAQTNSRSDQVTITRAHNHAPSSTRIEVLIAKSDIRRAAVNAISATPGAIVANALEGISEAAKNQLPKIANLKKTACRQRKSIGDGGGAHSMPLSSSKEALCKRVMQNYRRNAWAACPAAMNANAGGNRAAADTVAAQSTQSQYYDVCDPPLLTKKMPASAEKTATAAGRGDHCNSLKSAALDAVLMGFLPFNFIELPAMRSLLSAVFEFGKMNVPSFASIDSLPIDEMELRMEMRRRVALVRNTAEFEQFIELMKRDGCLSYAFDKMGGKSFVTIKGHVLNDRFELLCATLVFKEFSGVTVGEPLAIELAQCLNEQLGIFSADMAKMHHAIADGTIDVPFENASMRHVCLCDVLDNVIEHTTRPYGDSQLHNRPDTIQRLNELNKLIGRIRVIVFWICEHIGDSLPVFQSAHLRLFSPVVASVNRRRRFASTVTMLSSFVGQLEEIDAMLRNIESVGGGGEETTRIRREFEEIWAHKEELEAYLMATEPIVEWVEFFEESDQPTIHRALPALAGIESGLNTLRMMAMQNCRGGIAVEEAGVPNSALLQHELCEAALDALDWNISALRGAKVNKHLLCAAAALDPSAWRRELPAVFAKVARWTEEEMLAELRVAFTRAILSESHRRKTEQQQQQKQHHKMSRRDVPPVKRPLFSCVVEMDEEGIEGEEEEEEQRDEVTQFVTFAKQYRVKNNHLEGGSNGFNMFNYWNNDLASVTFSNLRVLARQILCVPGGHIDAERNFSVQNASEKLAREERTEQINETEMSMEDSLLLTDKCHAVQSSSSSSPVQPTPNFSGNVSALSFIPSDALTVRSACSLKHETEGEEAFVGDQRGDNNDQSWLMQLITAHDDNDDDGRDQQQQAEDEHVKDELIN